MFHRHDEDQSDQQHLFKGFSQLWILYLIVTSKSSSSSKPYWVIKGIKSSCRTWAKPKNRLISHVSLSRRKLFIKSLTQSIITKWVINTCKCMTAKVGIQFISMVMSLCPVWNCLKSINSHPNITNIHISCEWIVSRVFNFYDWANICSNLKKHS